MRPLTIPQNALLAPGSGRAKRFLAAFTGATLLFASAATSVALANGSSTNSPPARAAGVVVAHQSAINFGYGNMIHLT